MYDLSDLHVNFSHLFVNTCHVISCLKLKNKNVPMSSSSYPVDNICRKVEGTKINHLTIQTS